MSEYFATIEWRLAENEAFVDQKYSRGHVWCFDDGATVAASSSPHIVPTPYSVPENVDPEEAFIAALSSCHMLFFLSIAASQGFVVQAYMDKAIGVMGKDNNGDVSMTEVTLRPKIEFSGNSQPDDEQVMAIHHSAHQQCFIANSVKTKVTIKIRR